MFNGWLFPLNDIFTFKLKFMIKKVFKTPITILITIICIYTIYDYFEHIGREGSTFEAHPWYWLAFSITAILSLIIVVLLVKALIEKAINKKNLLIEIVAFGVWVALYLSFIGPFIDKVLWPFDDLFFSFKLGPFAFILLGYFIIRVVINLTMRKKILYSN